MKSTVHKRSILIRGHKTSVSLEDAFWQSLRDIARDRNLSVSGIANQIDATRDRHNLSSAIRLYVLEFYRSRAQQASVRQAA